MVPWQNPHCCCQTQKNEADTTILYLARLSVERQQSTSGTYVSHLHVKTLEQELAILKKENQALKVKLEHTADTLILLAQKQATTTINKLPTCLNDEQTNHQGNLIDLTDSSKLPSDYNSAEEQTLVSDLEVGDLGSDEEPTTLQRPCRIILPSAPHIFRFKERKTVSKDTPVNLRYSESRTAYDVESRVHLPYFPAALSYPLDTEIKSINSLHSSNPESAYTSHSEVSEQCSLGHPGLEDIDHERKWSTRPAYQEDTIATSAPAFRTAPETSKCIDSGARGEADTENDKQGRTWGTIQRLRWKTNSNTSEDRNETMTSWVEPHQFPADISSLNSPAFFKYGIRYVPSEGHENLYRTVMIFNLPKAVNLASVLDQVIGGRVIDAQILDTLPLTKQMSARIVFASEREARYCVAHARKHPLVLNGEQAQVSLIPVSTYPMSERICRAVFGERSSRCFKIHHLLHTIDKSAILNEVEFFARGFLSLMLVGIDCTQEDTISLFFASVHFALFIFTRLSTSRNYRDCTFTFLPDPCARNQGMQTTHGNTALANAKESFEERQNTHATTKEMIDEPSKDVLGLQNEHQYVLRTLKRALYAPTKEETSHEHIAKQGPEGWHRSSPLTAPLGCEQASNVIRQSTPFLPRQQSHQCKEDGSHEEGEVEDLNANMRPVPLSQGKTEVSFTNVNMPINSVDSTGSEVQCFLNKHQPSEATKEHSPTSVSSITEVDRGME